MADKSMVTDDEYLSPDEFTTEERDLQKEIAGLSKQIECLKKDKDEAHKYIKDMSARISENAVMEKEIKRLTVENKDLNSRLQTGDMEYVKLWKEVFPSKNNPQTTTTDKSVSNPVLMNEKTAEQITGTKEDRIQEFETVVKRLMAKLSEESQSKDKLKKRLEQVRDEKQALNEETSRRITECQNQNCKIQEKMRLMTATKDQLEKELEKEKEDRALLVKKLSDQHREYELKLAIKENVISIDVGSLKQQVDTIRRELEEKDVMLKKLTKVNQENEKRVLAGNGKVLSSKIESLQEKVDTLQSDLEKSRAECKREQSENEELRNLLKERDANSDDRHSTELTNEEPEKLSEEKENIKDDLSETEINLLTENPTKKKKTIELRLRSARCGMGKTMIDIVTRGMQTLLKDRLVREKIDLHIKPCETLDDDTGGPLFVLCLSRSIIGTKVNALEGVPGNKDTALIIIHYTDKKESLSLTTVGFRAYGSELRQLGGTIDMAFSRESGLYECDTNNSAVERMTTFLKKF
ncbi:putative leucine-rich repeat-containing protein DDB_G0290503 isoform X6 [Pecten maximus]|uniref:putative leucine-rich repeat-containing protein DDB_G0290503 isoform X6 n=1 Tax=Pecten maximus TaxID=6579 RepID=UPI001458DCCE|nr:putative leucine-rich repeat-containing protein DDB_G0290503 isoform X6 [Pecten maximus]